MCLNKNFPQFRMCLINMRPPCNEIITIFHWNDQQLHAFTCRVWLEVKRERQEFCKHRTVKAALWSGIIYRIFSVWNTSLAKRKTITTILWQWKYVKWIDSLGWTSFRGKCNLLFDKRFSIKNYSGSCKKN